MNGYGTNSPAPSAADRDQYKFWLARDKKDLRIIGFAFFGMIVLCAILHVVSTYSAGGVQYATDVVYYLILAAVGGFIGVYAGLAFAVVALLCLRGKDLRVAAFAIYAPTFAIATFLAVIPVSFFPGGNTVAIAAFALLCSSILAIVCRFMLADRPVYVPDYLCPMCNYDMRGASQHGCPECGWGR